MRHNEFSIGRISDLYSARRTRVNGLCENDRDYWWTHPKYEIDGKISKDSKEGVKIKGMLTRRKSEKDITAYIFGLALEAIGPDRLTTIIDNIVKGAKEDAFYRGGEARAREIRNALGIEE